MADKPARTCVPNTAFERVDWHDYFEIGAGFSPETEAAMEKALNNLSQTPEFARLCKLAQKRYAQYKHFSTPRGLENHYSQEWYHAPKIEIVLHRTTAADFGSWRIFINDNSSFSFDTPNNTLELVSLEHIFTHELLHLTDPLLVLRTCQHQFRQCFATILPDDFLQSQFATATDRFEKTIEDGYTVTHTNDLMARRFGEGRRRSYDETHSPNAYHAHHHTRGIDPELGITKWKTHDGANQTHLPLQRIDMFRNILSMTIDRMIESMENGSAQRPRGSWEYTNRTIKQKLGVLWKQISDDMADARGKRYLDTFVNPADAVYIQMALHGLEAKNAQGAPCNPLKPYTGFER
jgi:hypothetical protein